MARSQVLIVVKYGYGPIIILDDNDNHNGGKGMELSYIQKKTGGYDGKKAGYSSVIIIYNDNDDEEYYPQSNVGGKKGLFN